jgi:thiamine-phosphate pyrophosphorylase
LIQLREKDLPTRTLETLAKEAGRLVREARGEGSRTKLLINSRTDLALAVGADGVHLTSTDISASDVRTIASKTSAKTHEFLIAVSCHSPSEVRAAESHGADLAVLAPIFGKASIGAEGIGLAELRRAANSTVSSIRSTEAGEQRPQIKVLALGGVTVQNARECIDAGAAGVAGIRLFQQNNVAAVIAALRR